MKYCKYCGEDKPYTPGLTRNIKSTGFHGAQCWDCYTSRASAQYLERYHNNPATKAKAIAATTLWKSKNRATACKYSLAWQKNNPGICVANSRQYQLDKLQRIPSWANLEVIKGIYQEAAAKGLTVDHIIPLRGKNVSGLHVENNLQLLTKAENSRKSNNYENKV